MNHKQLLALFLCLVIIASSKIIASGNVVMVKDVSSNIDKYSIENIKEETDKESINIFYPVTHYDKVNETIKNKIELYRLKFEESIFTAENKKLEISFDEYEYGEYTSFKFNVKSNVGIYHDLEEVFTVTYKENEVVDIEYLKNKKQDILDVLYKECSEKLKNDARIKDYSTTEWLEQGLQKADENYNCFILTDKSFIVIFNEYTVAPYVAGILEVEIPYDKLSGII